MTRVILPIVFMALAGVIFFSPHFSLTGKQEVASRAIHIKGIFVLVDEANLLGRVKLLSENNPERQQFLDGVDAMLDGEPHVSSSSVRYSWPNDVVIEIFEVSPVAIINDDELLLRDCGVISKGSEQLPVELVNFDTDGMRITREHCQRIVELLPMLDSVRVTHVTMLVNGDYVFDIGGKQLVVGVEDARTSKDKIRKMVSLMNGNRMHAEYIDMRYVSGAAVRRVTEL